MEDRLEITVYNISSDTLEVLAQKVRTLLYHVMSLKKNINFF